jgi:hypothetical protein
VLLSRKPLHATYSLYSDEWLTALSCSQHSPATTTPDCVTVAVVIAVTVAVDANGKVEIAGKCAAVNAIADGVAVEVESEGETEVAVVVKVEATVVVAVGIRTARDILFPPASLLFSVAASQAENLDVRSSFPAAGSLAAESIAPGSPCETVAEALPVPRPHRTRNSTPPKTER